MALGNAGGQGSITATAGQVTGLIQTITASDEGGSTDSETLYGMIQTNADIVSGDSGGPLASSVGVIGMTTAGNDASFQQAAAGFAIPVNTALSVARRSPGGTPSRSATRRSWASSSAPDRAAARRLSRSSRRSRTAAWGAARPATPATLT